MNKRTHGEASHVKRDKGGKNQIFLFFIFLKMNEAKTPPLIFLLRCWNESMTNMGREREKEEQMDLG